MKNNTNTFKKNIILLSSGQPSVNPRLVKEADALAIAGYNVTVIYQYWNEWATKFDKSLLASKKWTSIRVGGSPTKKRLLYLLTRIIHKASRFIAKSLGFNWGIAEYAIGRCTALLYAEATKHKADLYIAHNLAALPAAVRAAKKQHVKCGFDIEDYHRNEVYNDPNEFDVRLKTYIDEKYIPLTDYLTASSQQIADAYLLIFPALKIDTILNVFPKNKNSPQIIKPNNILRLFWFSQSVGLNRGITDVLQMLKLLEYETIEFHILGFLNSAVKQALDNAITKLNFINQPAIFYHNPMHPDKLISFTAQFDIGLALEPGFSVNNNIALSNKIFTYINAGLTLIATDTPAQKHFINTYPSIGKTYKPGDYATLANIIKNYIDSPSLLNDTKQSAYQTGQTILNWETESKKFIAIVENTLSN